MRVHLHSGAQEQQSCRSNSPDCALEETDDEVVVVKDVVVVVVVDGVVTGESVENPVVANCFDAFNSLMTSPSLSVTKQGTE